MPDRRRVAGRVGRRGHAAARTGEELNTGAETVPRLAATVILLRGGRRRPRGPAGPAQPRRRGSWAAPGCSPAARSTPSDGDGEPGREAAAIRELARGGGHRARRSRRARPLLALDHAGGGQDPLRHLVLPRRRPRRRASHGSTARRSSTRAGSRPQEALARHRAGEIMLVFPTIKHLEQLSAFASAHALIAHARARTVAPGPAAGHRHRRDGPDRPARRARLRRLTAARTFTAADRRGHRPHRGHRPLAAPGAGAQPAGGTDRRDGASAVSTRRPRGCARSSTAAPTSSTPKPCAT